MNKLQFALILAAILAAGLPAKAAISYDTDVNPALVYWQAFSQLPELSTKETKLFENRQSAPTDAAYGALVARYETAFRLIRRGVDLKPRAAWGVDLADGPGALLSHLPKAKIVAQAAQLRARYFLEHGQENEAVQDLVAALVLGRHLASDGILISTLVQIAIDNIVQNCVAENFRGFSPDGLKRLMAGIDASPVGQTISQCIDTGERSFATWFLRKMQEIDAAHPGDEKKFLSEVRELLAVTLVDEKEKDYKPADDFIREAGGTQAGLLAVGKGADAHYDELKTVAALPYNQFEAGNKAFFDKVKVSKNPFAHAFLPALEKARSKEFRNQARMEMVRAAVQYRLRGEEGLKSVRDPFGSGPFGFQRFTFRNVDRGFELRSKFAYADEFPEVMIFVEKGGPPFRVLGPSAGKPIDEK